MANATGYDMNAARAAVLHAVRMLPRAYTSAGARVRVRIEWHEGGEVITRHVSPDALQDALLAALDRGGAR